MEPIPFIEAIESGTPLVVSSHRLILDGWDNLVVEVNGEYIFRFTRRENIHVQHLKELELLPLLGENLSLPVPFPEFSHTSSAPYFMGYRKIQGESLRSAHIHKNRVSITETISVFLRQLQRIPEDNLQRVEYLDPGSWKTQYHLLYERIEVELSALFRPRVWKRIQFVFKTYLDNRDNFIFKPVICHRDLTGDHILHRDGEITGVIDWGDACFGDPAFDLTGFITDYGHSFADRLCRKSNLPVSYLKRCEFYVMVMPFHGALHWVQMGDKYHLSKALGNIASSFR